MKRILEVNVDDQGFGGVYALVRQVILHHPEDCIMDVACIMPFSDPAHVEELKRVDSTVHFIGIKGQNHVSMKTLEENLYQLLSRIHYDYVHIHGDTAYRLYAFGHAARRAGVPHIIFHSHASGVDGNYRPVKYLLHCLYRGRLKKLGTDFAACSHLAGKWMFPGIPERDVVEIHNGINLEKFRFCPEDREEERRKLGLENAFVVGHVGRFSYQKNQGYLIDIFADLKKSRPDAKLLIIGSHEGNEKIWEDVKKKTEELGLTDDVIFYGTSEHVEKLLQAMDVFVLPSRFEGLSVVAVEAQAAGLPAVFSDQMTRETKLTENVDFVGIRPEDTDRWVSAILRVSKAKRRDTTAEIKSQGYDQKDMIDDFLNMYRDR
jgi:glycosyltransferase involved in cell wall biosynthesis